MAPTIIKRVIVPTPGWYQNQKPFDLIDLSTVKSVLGITTGIKVACCQDQARPKRCMHINCIDAFLHLNYCLYPSIIDLAYHLEALAHDLEIESGSSFDFVANVTASIRSVRG
jgi:hypothetical protein